MKLQSIKKAFTLIELLVVITIIGILATGATTVYTSQIQKARDSTRITDVKSMQSAIEQVYQDSSEYPHSNEFGTGGQVNVNTYMEKIPSDAKTGQVCNGPTACDYIYVVGPDDNSITFGEYELSTGFENDGNVSQRADPDTGDDTVRLEVGIDISNNITTSATAVTTSGCLGLDAAPATTTSVIKVNADCN